MDRSQLLSGLRREIIGLEAGQRVTSREMFSLGDPGVDRMLPGGGLPLSALHEIRGDAYRDAGAPGFMAGLLSRVSKVHSGQILWCRRAKHSQAGFIYGPGLSLFGLDPARFIFVTADGDGDVLWAAEEGLKCRGISAIVVEVDQLDLTSGRRLQLAATETGIPVFALNGHHEGGLVPLGATTAVSRWSVKSVSESRWHVSMERCRGGAPRSWLMEWNDETHCFSVVAPMAPGTGKVGETGKVAGEHFDKVA